MKKKLIIIVFLLLIKQILIGQNSAIDSLMKALKFHKNEDTLEVNLLMKCALEYSKFDKEKAIEFATKADSLADILNFSNGQLASLVFLSSFEEYSVMNILYYQKLIPLYEKIGNKQEIGTTLFSIAFIYYDKLKNYTKALDYYKQSLKKAEEAGDKKTINRCYSDIGNIYKIQNIDSIALIFYNKSIKISEERNDMTEINYCYISIGEIYAKKNNFLKANEYLQKSLSYFQKQSSGNEIDYYFCLIYTNLCNLNFKQKNYETSIIYANKCLEITEKQADIIYKNKVYHLLSEIYAATHNYKKAYECHKIHQTLNDSIFNDSNLKKLNQLELSYRYEKDKQARELGQQKKDAIQLADKKQQKTLLLSFIVGFILMFSIAVLAIRSYIHKHKMNGILTLQKHEIEEKNDELLQLNEEITSQKDEIEKQKDIIQDKNIDLTDSISYAQRIQDAVLPSSEILTINNLEHFILFKPRDIVSGDFYWFKQIKNFVFVVAADCTGHGVPGAFMSMLGISQLNEIITKRDVNPPNVILNELRKRIKKSLHQNGQAGQTQDGMDIAFCIIDIEHNILQYSGAFNSLYLIRKIDNHYELLETKADRMPIGVHPKDNQSFTNHQIMIQNGDVFYIFSDGYTSQFGGVENDTFKIKRLKETLLKIQENNMETQKQILEQTLLDWQGNNDQVDDILVIGIKLGI